MKQEKTRFHKSVTYKPNIQLNLKLLGSRVNKVIFKKKTQFSKKAITLKKWKIKKTTFEFGMTFKNLIDSLHRQYD